VATPVKKSNQVFILTQGVQGPPGPPGIVEEEAMYSKRIDFISESLLYKGEAAVGQPENASSWRIRRLEIYPDGDVTELWASGTADFVHTWADRASYEYS